MLLKKEMSRSELLDYLYQFGETYGDALDNIDLRFIFDNCEQGNTKDEVPYLLNQFYSEYKLIDVNKNIYYSILKKLIDTVTIDDKRVLEVGGGPVPILGRLIAEKAEKVTVMDSNVSIKNGLDNMYLENKLFLNNTDINDYDLVVSFMACGASKSIIDNCTKHDTDFFIGLCPCGMTIDKEFDPTITNKKYMDLIIDYAKRKVMDNNMGTLEIDKLEDQPFYNSPIIYNKRKKLIYKKR